MQKLTDRLDRPIVLVGLMGVGKSTVGRRLAKRLGLPFVDSDSEIEDAVGLPAGEVFERYGEKDYRDGERRLVARLIDGEVRVIATGGGVFVDPATRELLKKQAITVWLDAPVDVLAERTSRRDTRPLLRTADPKQTLEQLAALERHGLCRGRHPYPQRRRRPRRRRRTRSSAALDRILERQRQLGRVDLLVGQRAVDAEHPAPCRRAGRRSRSAPAAAPRRAADIRGLDPVRLALGDAQLQQRLAAHRHRAFEHLALQQREVEPGEVDQLPAVEHADHHRRLREGLEHRLQLARESGRRRPGRTGSPSAVSAPAVRSRSIRVPSP